MILLESKRFEESSVNFIETLRQIGTCVVLLDMTFLRKPVTWRSTISRISQINKSIIVVAAVTKPEQASNLRHCGWKEPPFELCLYVTNPDDDRRLAIISHQLRMAEIENGGEILAKLVRVLKGHSENYIKYFLSKVC